MKGTTSICNSQGIMVVLNRADRRYIRKLLTLYSADRNTVHRLRLQTEAAQQHRHLQASIFSSIIQKSHTIHLWTS